jgi:hypothetical protein
LIAQQADVQVPFNVEVTEELVSHYINFIVIYLFFSNCVICHSETNRHHIFLSNLQIECILDAILESVKSLIVGHLDIDLHKELHEAKGGVFFQFFFRVSDIRKNLKAGIH